MIVVVDNYDSFTWNLVQCLRRLGATVQVHQNDRITVDELTALAPDAIVLSPGPGAPDGAGITLACVERLSGRTPILGVCLGHQAIAQVFGGRVVRARRLMHGRTSSVFHAGGGSFASLPSPFVAMRYHSLVVEPGSVPSELEVTAWTRSGEVMGLRHRRLLVEGVQFHPESFLTEHGSGLLARFLRAVESHGAAVEARRVGRQSSSRCARARSAFGQRGGERVDQ